MTISSTETKLLAILQMAKKAIYMFCLLLALNLRILYALSIDCDNAQTHWLLVNKSTKLQTKLCHIDIHSYWLRQEVQRGLINIR